MRKPVDLAYPEGNYRDRLTTLALGTVYRGVTAEEVKKEIERRREIEGDVIAEDFAKLCRELWKDIY